MVVESDVSTQGGSLPGPRGHSFLAAVFMTRLERIENEADGVLGDDWTDPLHDLRVACRKTRSLLRELRPWLQPSDRDWENEWRWLGSQTGLLRDLDVFAHCLAGYARDCEPPLSAHFVDKVTTKVAEAQLPAREQAVAAIDSERFQRLVQRWRLWIEEDLASAKGPYQSLREVAASELATRALGRTGRRVLKRASRLSPASPIDDWHRLRIQSKRLRYLLEAVSPLAATGRWAAALAVELKALQSGLGELNDLSVHQVLVARLLSEEGSSGTGEVSVLDGFFDQRLEARCSALEQQLAGFLERAPAWLSSASFCSSEVPR